MQCVECSASWRKDYPIGHRTVTGVFGDTFLQKKFLKCGTFCHEYMVLQGRWLLMAVVSRERFHCIINRHYLKNCKQTWDRGKVVLFSVCSACLIKRRNEQVRLYTCFSVWCKWGRQRSELRCPQRHPHRHHGLHRPRVVHRHGVPTDVGGVWVGKQGGCQHQHSRSPWLPGTSYPIDKHEVSHTREGELCWQNKKDIILFLGSFFVHIKWLNLAKQHMGNEVKDESVHWIWTHNSASWGQNDLLLIQHVLHIGS